jgi:hypothetical protein
MPARNKLLPLKTLMSQHLEAAMLPPVPETAGDNLRKSVLEMIIRPPGDLEFSLSLLSIPLD